MTIVEGEDPTMYLGRHVEHDPRSLAYPASTTGTVKPVHHRHYGPILDQGQLGSCTGNAAAQALNTAPFHQKAQAPYTEQDAVSIYSLATQLDGVAGQYPPDDTGSSGLGVAKALMQMGKIKSYNHVFGFDHFVGAIQVAPLIVGVSWHQSMFTPDAQGYVRPDGAVVGGHEFCAVGYTDAYVEFVNSWGAGWGRNGRFRMTHDDFTALLADQGDATQFVV